MQLFLKASHFIKTKKEGQQDRGEAKRAARGYGLSGKPTHTKLKRKFRDDAGVIRNCLIGGRLAGSDSYEKLTSKAKQRPEGAESEMPR